MTSVAHADDWRTATPGFRLRFMGKPGHPHKGHQSEHLLSRHKNYRRDISIPTKGIFPWFPIELSRLVPPLQG